MIDAKCLNRSKSKALLLIHGLFANAGFWLPYLKSLKEFKLIILDIDYSGIDDINLYLDRLKMFLKEETGGELHAVISHSFGSLLASQLPSYDSYEVCPVHCATRKNVNEFACDIENKIKFSMNKKDIMSFLSQVDGIIADVKLRRLNTLRSWSYIPDLDPYFSYQASGSFEVFSGDHFNIMTAMADIGRRLSR